MRGKKGGRVCAAVHDRKPECNFQEKLVLQKSELLFPCEFPGRRLPSPALSAVKTQSGLKAVSKRLCFGPWPPRQGSFLSVIGLEVFVP